MSKIQITCDTDNAQIYYSINNNNLDQLYNEPFEMNEGGEIYAIGRKEGMEESDVGSKEVIKLPDPELHNVGRNTYIDNIQVYEELLGEDINNLYFLGGISFVSKVTYQEAVSNNYIVLSSGEKPASTNVKVCCPGYLDSNEVIG